MKKQQSKKKEAQQINIKLSLFIIILFLTFSCYQRNNEKVYIKHEQDYIKELPSSKYSIYKPFEQKKTNVNWYKMSSNDIVQLFTLSYIILIYMNEEDGMTELQKHHPEVEEFCNRIDVSGKEGIEIILNREFANCAYKFISLIEHEDTVFNNDALVLIEEQELLFESQKNSNIKYLKYLYNGYYMSENGNEKNIAFTEEEVIYLFVIRNYMQKIDESFSDPFELIEE